MQNNSSLPVLSHASEEIYQEAELGGVLLIACQHLLGTTYSMFERFFRKGLKPSNSHLIGKCYSTNEQVLDQFREAGVNVSDNSNSFHSHRSYDNEFQDHIDEFLINIEQARDFDEFERIIILDDGGELLAYANDFFDKEKEIVGIEQTTSGVRKLEDAKLHFPVINVARSQAKLELESPLIGGLIADKVREYINSVDIKTPDILLVGEGYIGQRIAESLQEDFSVSLADAKNEKGEFEQEFKHHLEEFEVIIGATGNVSLEPGDFGNLSRDTHLISASSSDREFSAVYLRRKIDEYYDCHRDITVGNGITLVNSGFPINFDGGYHSLPPEEIQLTRSLLFSAVCEAASLSSGDGFISLNSSVQEELEGIFRKEGLELQGK